MSDLILRSWNNKTIRQREDGYISATDMCQACGKEWYEFSRSKYCEEYVESLRKIQHKENFRLLIESVSNGAMNVRGTWIHRKLALRLAQWLSTDFAVQVDSWIEELLLKGYVAIKNHSKSSVKQSRMTLKQIDWLTDSMVAEGSLKAEDRLDFKLTKAAENFPEMIPAIQDARKLMQNQQSSQQLNQENESKVLYERMRQACIKQADKKNKSSLIAQDLAGDSLTRRKDFMTRYCIAKAKQLNKPEIHQVWQEMHELGLGVFNKIEGTFTPNR